MLNGKTHIYVDTTTKVLQEVWRPEGEKRVFERSIKKHKLRYVEFLGDGDTKSYVNVKATYPGIEVKKLECFGHYQKTAGTRLQNLKKGKGIGWPRAPY